MTLILSRSQSLYTTYNVQHTPYAIQLSYPLLPSSSMTIPPPPPPLTTTAPQKRPSPSRDQDRPAIKNRRREYHHHRLQTPMESNLLPDSALTDATAVDTLLKLSIGVLLRDCGFSHADPVALDSFRSAVEECMYYSIYLFYCIRDILIIYL